MALFQLFHEISGTYSISLLRHSSSSPSGSQPQKHLAVFSHSYVLFRACKYCDSSQDCSLGFQEQVELTSLLC